MLNSSPDVVIVGAGIAGSALALSVARTGYGVVVLEKSLVHADRVRGELIVPWGVAEARDLGVLDLLESAGGNYTVRSIPYGEGMSPDEAAKTPMPMDKMVPAVRGALNLGHPRICNTLNASAEAAGVIIVRGVDKIQVYPGLQPRVEFIHEGIARILTPRLIVGADGRGSSIARQTGFQIEIEPVHHIFTGLLVDQVDAWAADEQSIGVDGDVGFYVLPQGGGKLRLYIAHGLDQKARFAGVGSSDRLIAAMNRSSLPCGEALSRARAIGPCRGYPNSNAWIDNPVVPGVVLIGDAAGYSDPTGGQGISTALNDVRLVTQALSEAKDWTPEALGSYVEHRRERTRRVRFSTQLLARYRMEFTAEARQRRAKGRERMAANPELMLPLLAMQKGPFAVPETAYSPGIWDQLIG